MKDKPLVGTLDLWSKEIVTPGCCVVWGRIDKDAAGRFRDGTYMRTSVTQDIPMKEGDVIETFNSRYTLGVPVTMGGLHE